MDTIRGDDDQLVAIRLPGRTLESDPDLFYTALDHCRKEFFKCAIKKLPDGGAEIRSALAWEHQESVGQPNQPT
jgi:hypothetical protein